MSLFDPPEPPIQFVEDDEICEHNNLKILNYQLYCEKCKEDHNLEKLENDRKS